MARPSKYTKTMPKKLLEHLKSGLSFKSFGAIAGVTESTLHNWRHEYPEFEEAYRLGEMHRVLFWEKLNRDAAVGDSKVNTALVIFALKNQLHWTDHQKIETKDTTEDKTYKVEIKEIGLSDNTTQGATGGSKKKD